MMQHCAPMRRRTFFGFGLGIGGAILLGLGGVSIATWRPGVVGGRLSPSGRSVFESVGRAVLDGSLPAESSSRDAAVRALLTRLDVTISAFPWPVQEEISQLLALLSATAGRLGLARLRHDWPEAKIGEVQAALQDMRTSALSLRQQAYHALRDLTNAAFYADPTTWAQIGYPGPNPI